MSDSHDHHDHPGGHDHPDWHEHTPESRECALTESGHECALTERDEGPHTHAGLPGHEGHEHHVHNLKALSQRRLLIALIINAAFLVVEVVGGLAA